MLRVQRVSSSSISILCLVRAAEHLRSMEFWIARVSGIQKASALLSPEVENWEPHSPKAKDVLGTDGYIAPEAYLGAPLCGGCGDGMSLSECQARTLQLLTFIHLEWPRAQGRQHLHTLA